MILRSKATRPENSELKRVQRELQKSKTLAKHFKLTMFEEREALKKEVRGACTGIRILHGLMVYAMLDREAEGPVVSDGIGEW
eukprot:308104-Amorphochlora_amoeboformis.AAC.1